MTFNYDSETELPRRGYRSDMKLALATLLCLCISACMSEPPKGTGPHTFDVGPGRRFEKPSDVAALVGPGDIVKIAPGTYADCAVWPGSAPGLKLIGTDGKVTLADKVCADKAIFVVQGDDTLVRGITFKGAKSSDHNGAGIRLESRKLTIEDSHFVGNEDGILTFSTPQGELVIRNSSFENNGNCIECGHGLYVGHFAHVRIEHSTFVGQHTGHHIKSRAANTEIIDTIVRDGPDGTSSYLVDIPNGGNLMMLGDTLEKGPLAENKTTAISIGAEGVNNPTNSIRILNCVFTNNTGGQTAFVTTYTDAPIELDGNTLKGDIVELRRVSH